MCAGIGCRADPLSSDAPRDVCGGRDVGRGKAGATPALVMLSGGALFGALAANCARFISAPCPCAAACGRSSIAPGPARSRAPPAHPSLFPPASPGALGFGLARLARLARLGVFGGRPAPGACAPLRYAVGNSLAPRVLVPRLPGNGGWGSPHTVKQHPPVPGWGCVRRIEGEPVPSPGPVVGCGPTCAVAGPPLFSFVRLALVWFPSGKVAAAVGAGPPRRSSGPHPARGPCLGGRSPRPGTAAAPLPGFRRARSAAIRACLARAVFRLDAEGLGFWALRAVGKQAV